MKNICENMAYNIYLLSRSIKNDTSYLGVHVCNGVYYLLVIYFYMHYSAEIFYFMEISCYS